MSQGPRKLHGKGLKCQGAPSCRDCVERERRRSSCIGCISSDFGMCKDCLTNAMKEDLKDFKPRVPDPVFMGKNYSYRCSLCKDTKVIEVYGGPNRPCDCGELIGG